MTDDQPCRPRYFDRQAIDAADLNALVDWVRARDRRHNRALVGWGVACGLGVTRDAGSTTRVRVAPGHAVMPSGDEVAVPADVPAYDVWAEACACLGIAGACPNPTDLTATGAVVGAGGAPRPVWLALCPAETPTGFRPGVPEKCGPAGGALLPSRVCEGYRFRILCSPPPSAPDADAVAAIVCDPALTPCPAAAAEDAVVIATLTVDATGIVAIDPFADRRRILPQGLLGARTEAQCDLPPPPTPPPSTPPPSLPPATHFTEFTLFTDLTPVTRPPRFTDFTLFTDLTPVTRPTRFVPSRFTFASEFVSVTRGIGPLDPSDPVINVSLGETIAIDTLAGIDPVHTTLLDAIGVRNVADFLSQPSDRLAGVLGVSEVQVAGMQVAALQTIRALR